MATLVASTSRKRPAAPGPVVASVSNLSKITPPTLQRVHANTRLFDRLDAACRHRVVWVHGPPGAGKTTLVASYLAARRIAPLWYRLDGGDADPATVFFYLSKAAQQGASGQVSLPLLTPEFRAALPLFTRGFFRDLFAASEAKVVVFDDYHEVATGAALHACLPHGLEEVPDGCHMVIISRTPPPAQLARLRLNGLVDVVEPDALRMTQEEASGVAHQRGADATAARVEAITRQTQGWAAGVILMLEAGAEAFASARPEAGAPVPELLFDYFAGEILQRMDARTQRLLSTLALLPSMTASTAERLTGSTEAGALLEDLRKRNYFTSLDAAESRHRFHPLFRDFLLESARQRLPRDAFTALQIEAATILDEDGQPEASVNLLADAGAVEQLADLIRRRAAALLGEGRNDTLVAWLQKLPAAMIEADGWLSYWYGAAPLYLAPAIASARLRTAFGLFEKTDDVAGQYLAWAGEAEAVRVDAFGDFTRYDRLLDALPKLLVRHPEIPKGAAALVTMGMATGLSRRRNDRAAIRLWQERAEDEARDAQRPGLAEVMGYMFATTDFHDANHAAARCRLDALPDPFTLDHFPPAQAAGLIVHCIAIFYRQMDGDIVVFAEEALRRLEAQGFVLWMPLVACLAANDARRRDDIPSSRAWLQRATAYADRVSPHRGAHYHMTAAQFYLSTGDIAVAMTHAEKAISLSLGWHFYEAHGRSVRAEILVESTALAEAEAELDRLDNVLAKSACGSLAFPAALLRAELLFASGNDCEGTKALARAMALGRHQDQRRPGLMPQRVSLLCRRALQLKIELVYVRSLIHHAEIPAPDPYDESWPWPIRITTLGGFAVERAGEPLTFSRKTPKRLIALLKAIATYGGRNVPEEKLVDAVWPDEEGDAARSSLTIAIHRLRKLLGDGDAITVSGGTVGLDPRRCWLDLWTVDHLVVPGPHPNDGREPRCERIFSLYRGDFLPEESTKPGRHRAATSFVAASPAWSARGPRCRPGSEPSRSTSAGSRPRPPPRSCTRGSCGVISRSVGRRTGSPSMRASEKCWTRTPACRRRRAKT